VSISLSRVTKLTLRNVALQVLGPVCL